MKTRIVWNSFIVCAIASLAIRLYGQTGTAASNATLCHKLAPLVCDDPDIHCEGYSCNYPSLSNYSPEDIDDFGYLDVEYACPESVEDIYAQSPDVEDCVDAPEGGFELRSQTPQSAVCWISYPCQSACTVTNEVDQEGEFVVNGNVFPYKILKAVCNRLPDRSNGESETENYFSCENGEANDCPPPPSPPTPEPPTPEPPTL